MAHKISDIELQGIVEAEVRNSISFLGSDLSAQRAESIDYYLGKPFGDERDGRSQVVSTDVADTIEWILPQLIRIFASGDETVCFEPTGPEDVEVASQATDYVNYVWDKDNNGFLNYYTWFKDALLTKVGTVKTYWEDREKTAKERYQGLTDAEFAEIVSPDDVEVLEHTEYEGLATDPNTGSPIQDELTGGAVVVILHDVVLERTTTEGRVRVEPVPPEEFLIDRSARSIADARMVGHRRRRTLADLVESGFKLEDVKNLSSDDSDGEYDNEEEIARDTVEDEGEGQSVGNEMMRRVWVVEAYIKIDMEGKGKAEMRQVTVAGNGYKLLKNEAWDGPAPFSSLTPIIMPHRFYGLAVADLIKDLQRIKSVIFRQYLDNLYIQNNPKEVLDVSRLLDPQQALSSVPGQKVFAKNLEKGSPVIPVPTQDVGPAAIQGLEYTDKVREQRTGVSERTQGLESNTLHDTFGGEQILMTAALAKIELIARIFAETGVRDVFRQILHLVTQYQDQERTVRLRNEWVPMDPSSWSPDMDVSVSVGLGTGDKQQQLVMGMQLLKEQKEAFANGFAEYKHLRETAEIITNAMGFKGVDRFFSSEEEVAARQASQNQQNPEVMKAQAEIAADQAKMQFEQQQAAQELDLKREEAAANLQLKRDQLQGELDLKREQLRAELELQRELGMMKLTMGAGPTSPDGIGGGVHLGGDPG